MERDILAQIKHPFIVDLKYGESYLLISNLMFHNSITVEQLIGPLYISGTNHFTYSVAHLFINVS